MRCGFCVYIIFSLLLSSNVAASNNKYVFAFYGSDSTLSFLCKFNVVREILSVKLNRPPSISHFCCCCWLSLSRQLARSSSACARDFPLNLPTTSELEMMDKKKLWNCNSIMRWRIILTRPTCSTQLWTYCPILSVRMVRLARLSLFTFSNRSRKTMKIIIRKKPTIHLLGIVNILSRFFYWCEKLFFYCLLAGKKC